MADHPDICGEKDCVLSYGEKREPIFAPPGTQFTPGVVIGRFVDDPTPPDAAWRIDPATLTGVFFLFVAAFAAYLFRKSIRARAGTSRR